MGTTECILVITQHIGDSVKVALQRRLSIIDVRDGRIKGAIPLLRCQDSGEISSETSTDENPVKLP